MPHCQDFSLCLIIACPCRKLLAWPSGRAVASPSLLWEDSFPVGCQAWGWEGCLPSSWLASRTDPSQPWFCQQEPVLAPCTDWDGEGRGELGFGVKTHLTEGEQQS